MKPGDMIKPKLARHERGCGGPTLSDLRKAGRVVSCSTAQTADGLV